jgi:hypothetical protein
MKEYIYFVSYAHGQNGVFGFGSAEVPIIRPIESHVEIIAIEEALKQKDKQLKQVVVLFFSLLREKE